MTKTKSAEYTVEKIKEEIELLCNKNRIEPERKHASGEFIERQDCAVDIARYPDKDDLTETLIGAFLNATEALGMNIHSNQNAFDSSLRHFMNTFAGYWDPENFLHLGAVALVSAGVEYIDPQNRRNPILFLRETLRSLYSNSKVLSPEEICVMAEYGAKEIRGKLGIPTKLHSGTFMPDNDFYMYIFAITEE